MTLAIRIASEIITDPITIATATFALPANSSCNPGELNLSE